MRIVISLPEGQNVRNLLENNIIEELNRVFQRPEILILTPAYNISSFTDIWTAKGNIKWGKLLPFQTSRKQRYLFTYRRKFAQRKMYSISRFLLARERDLEYTGYEYYYQLLAEKPKETLVLCSHIHLPFEIPLANAAKKLGIPVIGLVNSWDNVYKGIQTHPDKVLVWGDINFQDMVHMEGYDPERVLAIGAPPFDLYFDRSILQSREVFCDKIGLDPKRPIFLYASIGQYVPFFEETFLLKELEEIANEFAPHERPQIICRLHPWSKKELFKDFVANKDIVFSAFENYVPTLNWCPTRDEIIFSANLLKHSAICISPGSTMVLEAAIFDTPTIVPVYNAYQPEIWDNYYKRFCLAMHFGRLAHNGFVPIVRNREQLKSWVLKYMTQPSAMKDKRKQIVNDYIKYQDGESIQRIVKELEKVSRQNGRSHNDLER
jgi:hypothetical protein